MPPSGSPAAAPSWLPKLTAPRKVNWQGRYVDAGAVEAGQTLRIEFPIGERIVSEIEQRALLSKIPISPTSPAPGGVAERRRGHFAVGHFP